MSGPGLFSKEARALAKSLVNEKRLTVRQLQQGTEWCQRNEETLLTFLNRFCALELEDSQLAQPEDAEPRRRIFARFPSDRRLWVEVREKLVEVITMNVSRGGLAFRSRWALEVGQEIRVAPEHRVLAIVRYCVDDTADTTAIGAEFAPRTVEDLQSIEELLSSLTAGVLGP